MSAVNLQRDPQSERREAITDASQFGQVAVLYGGFSSEREVSLQTGGAVLAALRAAHVAAIGWDPAERPLSELASAGIDRVFIALHGPGGEDGSLQGALQWQALPFTGSGVMASALAMDKVRTKHLLRALNLPTPDYVVANDRAQAMSAAADLGYPLIVKPSREGSSVGMTKIFAENDLAMAVDLALDYDDVVLIERCIVGAEFTVSILQGQALPSIRIETPHVFYDYRAKYVSDSTRYFCPGTNDPVDEQRYASLALSAFDALGCSGWGRVDFMTGADREPQILEVNTVPGMTSHSLVPMAAKHAGIGFDDLCWRILETSLCSAARQVQREVAVNGT